MLRSRVLPVFLAATVVAAGLARTHVHDYAEHDHPEHHHGPAAHSHTRHHAHGPEVSGRPSMGPCDPGDHDVALQAASIPTKPFGPAFVAVLVHATPATADRRSVPVRREDVRVHGPPPETPSAPRAPPVVHPA